MATIAILAPETIGNLNRDTAIVYCIYEPFKNFLEFLKMRINLLDSTIMRLHHGRKRTTDKRHLYVYIGVKIYHRYYVMLYSLEYILVYIYNYMYQIICETLSKACDALLLLLSLRRSGMAKVILHQYILDTFYLCLKNSCFKTPK